MATPFRFEVRECDRHSGARIGLLETPHALIETPAFMPVGTQGTVKAMLPEQVSGAGYKLILANTYHLMVRPGTEVVAAHGGLHRMMGWDGAILTDSGGFQIYSLSSLRKVSEKSVLFRSHVDGALFEITPERAIEIQETLGSDIAMALDVCPSSVAKRSELELAVEITTKWASRCLAARKKTDQAVFGIVQGGLELDLRREHAAVISKMPFEGIALGGFSVGEPPALMYPVVEKTAAMLPFEKPRYLMGVGAPVDLVRCIMAGIDLFDCVFPTRAARNGLLLTYEGRLVLKNSRYRNDLNPPDPSCLCPTCARFSRAYLRHLYMAKEITASVLATLHNLYFYSRLIDDIKQAIRSGTLGMLSRKIERAYKVAYHDESSSAI